jgi:hypothetical protein
MLDKAIKALCWLIEATGLEEEYNSHPEHSLDFLRSLIISFWSIGLIYVVNYRLRIN